MEIDKKTTALIILGIFGSIGAGLALIIAGGVTGIFKLAVAGIVVLVGGTLLTIIIFTTVYTVKYLRYGYHEIQPATFKSPSTFKNHDNISKTPKGKNIIDLMDKEDEFTANLEANGRLDILKQYKAEAEPIWERYTGDEWDNNLQQIDELIDKYKQVIKNAETQ